jgi:hypothetical protein
MQQVRTILITILACLCPLGMPRTQGKTIAVDLDYTFASRYLWRGFDVYDGHTASQSSVNVDLFESGFGVNVWHSRANGSGFENIEELDYTLYYSNTLFADQWRQVDFAFAWVYFDYVDSPSVPFDLQEGGLTMSLPKALPGGLVPSYALARLWPARSGSSAPDGVEGWVHVFGLAYDWTVPALGGWMQDQAVCLTADLTYNDGYGGSQVDHDWSHATIGASTSFALTENLAFTPAFYYQLSLDDSVNDENEFKCALSMTLSL